MENKDIKRHVRKQMLNTFGGVTIMALSMIGAMKATQAIYPAREPEKSEKVKRVEYLENTLDNIRPRDLLDDFGRRYYLGLSLELQDHYHYCWTKKELDDYKETLAAYNTRRPNQAILCLVSGLLSATPAFYLTARRIRKIEKTHKGVENEQ
jgi:hypothetical protein